MPLPEPPTHVVVPQTPGWQWLVVRHLPSREVLEDVIEARAGPASGPYAGYVVRQTGRLNAGGGREVERIACAIRIEWLPGLPQDAIRAAGGG